MEVRAHTADDYRGEVTGPPNKELKLRQPGKRRSFAA
jgi:hypothetical protein